jgi:hypothetical protein
MGNLERIFTESLDQYSMYYSKMQRSIDFITSLEKKYIDSNTLFPPNFQKTYPDLCKIISLSEMRKVNVTEFRRTIVEPFIMSLDESTQQKLKDVWVGLLPTHKTNALCCYVPNTIIPVIIVYDKIIGALSFRAESFIIFGELLKHDEKLAHSFLFYSSQKLVDFFSNKVQNLPIYSLPSDVKMFSLRIACAQELFLVAHEFAHIYLDHLDLAEVENLFLEGDINLEHFSFEQKLELEADLQAAKWMMNFKKKNVQEGLLAFANHFDSIIEILPLFHLIQENIDSDTQHKGKKRSHPSAEDRLHYIYSNLKDCLSEDECKSIEKTLIELKMGFRFTQIKVTEQLDNVYSNIVNNKLFTN